MTEQPIEERLAKSQQEKVFAEDSSRQVEAAMLESEMFQKRIKFLESQQANLKHRLEEYRKTNHKDLALIEELIKKIGEFRDMAFYDDLTGLYKRKAFVELLKCFKVAGVKSGCLLLLDIDKFKSINDFYSHKKGDDVLVRVAVFLGESFRATDPITRITAKEKSEAGKQETHTVGRIGGEEIAIFVPNASLEDVEKILFRISHNSSNNGAQISLEIDMELGSLDQEAERLKKAGDISEEEIPKRSNKITFSGGVLLINLEEAEDMESFAEKALEVVDKALYEAKRKGRNQILLIQTELNE